MTNLHMNNKVVVFECSQAQIESDLCKENVQLKHLVDSLQRDNVHYKELESQYQLVTSQVNMLM